MSANITEIGSQRVKSVTNGQSVELRKFWEDKNVAIIFFRRWGCMFCRLWAKELAEIAPILAEHNIGLIGVGVEEAGSKEFVDGKYFDGDLYYVEDISTYQLLGFKRFNLVSILTSLFWKQSREAIYKGRDMNLSADTVGDGLQSGGMVIVKNGKQTLHFIQLRPADRLPNCDIMKVMPFLLEGLGYGFWNDVLGGDLKGDWVQVGGALLVQKGGNLLRHFVQTGPGEHLPNLDILKNFGLEQEYNHETMANKSREEALCTTEIKS